MNQIQKSDEFDLEAIRQKIRQESAAVRDSEAPPASESVPLNAFARQIAEQFRQTSYTPNLLIGQLRLLEFLALPAWASMPGTIPGSRRFRRSPCFSC